MQIIFLVLPLALLLAAIAVLAFIWAVRTGQMDDLDTPAMRVLHDDEPARSATRTPPDKDEKRSPAESVTASRRQLERYSPTRMDLSPSSKKE